MDESDEKSSLPEAPRDSERVEPASGQRTTWWLVAGIATASAVLGFYSSVRVSDSLGKADPAVTENVVTPEPVQPEPIASPLAFLSSRTSQRPASVEILIEEAKRVTACLVEGFPNDPGTHDMAARLHDKCGDSQKAAGEWETSLQLNANYSHAYRGLATLATMKGENEKAVHLLRRVLVLDPNSFDSQIQLAQALVDLNRMEEAIRLLERNVTADPKVHRGRVLLGMAFMHLEEYQKAKENYRAAIEAHPKHANAHFGLATACARLGQQELQQEYLAKFQELRAGEREIAAGQRHQFDDLEAMCAGVAQIYTDTARICLAHGSPSEAVMLCRRAAVLDPRNTDCRQALAWMYRDSGMHTEVIRTFEQLIRIEPENLSYPREIARIYEQMGRLPAAEETLRKVCDEAPENAAGYVALANFLLRQNRSLTEAVEMAQTAARLAPRASNYVLLSTAHEKSGEIPKAVEAMAKVVELAPDSLKYEQMYELLKEKQSD